MIRPGADQAEREQWERDVAHGQADPDRSELDAAHDLGIEQADFLHEAGRVAYVERPTDRERKAHRDELKARRDTRPTGGHVERVARTGRCDCGARETGYPHPGHRYVCPRYSKNPTRDAA